MTRHSNGRGARKLLLWSALSFVGFQLALNVFMEAQHPEVFDPEFRDRLVVLRQRVSEHPDRPLLLVVGSSRIINGFAPEQLPRMVSAQGEHVLPFNAGHSGAGPLQNLLTIDRLLGEGFEPKWVVIEVVPYLLPAAQQTALAKVALARDFPLLGRYLHRGKLYARYGAERATASYHHRLAFVRHVAPCLLFEDATWDCLGLEPLGGKVWVEKAFEPAEIARRTAVVRATVHASLHRFQVHDISRRAMRELLDRCRQSDIQALLLIAPESSEFRSWYSPEAKQLTAQFCAELKNEFDVPVIDARAWLPDDAFSDGHHTLPDGAKQFTARLGAEVIEPLVKGTLRDDGTPAQPNRTRPTLAHLAQPSER